MSLSIKYRKECSELAHYISVPLLVRVNLFPAAYPQEIKSEGGEEGKKCEASFDAPRGIR
jgi:hypothetical protein